MYTFGRITWNYVQKEFKDSLSVPIVPLFFSFSVAILNVSDISNYVLSQKISLNP
jgi:hypothetical protein